MADLNPLIRVRRHAVEQKQKFLAELYRQAEELEAHKRALQEQLAIETERAHALNAIDALSDLSRYSAAVHDRIADIDEARGQLEIRIEAAREDMREAFAEVKKIEITQNRREEEEAIELLKKEADELDAIGIELHRRRQEEDSL